MSDKELLELAAKAAGLEPQYNTFGEKYYRSQWVVAEETVFSTNHWNPLTDDGDALWLAVKLGIDLTLHGTVFAHPYAHSEISPYYASYGDNYFEEEETEKQDIFAATRRAIVRAAAEIGKEMP